MEKILSTDLILEKEKFAFEIFPNPTFGNNFNIKRVPVVPAQMNSVVDTTYIKISGNDIQSLANSVKY